MSFQQYRPSSFSLLPDVVKNLLIINGLFFLATIVLSSSFNIELLDIFGLHFIGSEKFQPYQFITYMFLHGNVGHIFFNMFAVWMFGSALENLWGIRRFLFYYLVTGIGAALIHYIIVYFQIAETLEIIDQYVISPDLSQLKAFLESEHLKLSSFEMQLTYNNFIHKYNALISGGMEREALQASVDFMLEYKKDFLNAPVVVGASGALFGLLLAFGMMFPNSEIFIYFLFPVKAKYFVAIYGAIELWSGIQQNPADNVAHFAHLGGMLFGYIIIAYWNKTRRDLFF